MIDKKISNKMKTPAYYKAGGFSFKNGIIGGKMAKKDENGV